MGERQISGARTDLSPSEFKAKMDKVAPKDQKRKEKSKNFWGKLIENMSSLGLLPPVKSDYKGPRGHAHGGSYHSQGGFKASYRVDTTPQPRTHEQWLVDEMAHQAYHDLVDGKGDHDCGHEH